MYDVQNFLKRQKDGKLEKISKMQWTKSGLKVELVKSILFYSTLKGFVWFFNSLFYANTIKLFVIIWLILAKQQLKNK